MKKKARRPGGFVDVPRVSEHSLNTLFRFFQQKHIPPDSAGNKPGHNIPAVHGGGFADMQSIIVVFQRAAPGGDFVFSCLDNGGLDVNDNFIAVCSEMMQLYFMGDKHIAAA